MPYPLPPDVTEDNARIVADLPPLTDAELDAVADAIALIRLHGGQGK